MNSKLQLIPIPIKRARIFIETHHRHTRAPNGGLFAVGITTDGKELCGCAVIATPIARGLADGWTCEATRVCVIDGHPNACSMLYGAAARAAKALGYKRIVTYTLASEKGTSLKAAGWKVDALVKWKPWDHKATGGRKVKAVDLFGARVKYSTEDKVRWVRPLA